MVEGLSRRRFGAVGAGALGALAVGAAEAGAFGSAAGGSLGAGAPVGLPRRRLVQMRGSWIATVVNTDWPLSVELPARAQRRALLARLDEAVRRNLNTVVLQVRPAADAFFPSPYEPWSEWLTGVQGRDPGWDPLGFAVREAHARGMRLHAWFNPYRIRRDERIEMLADRHPARLHPDWVVRYNGGLYYNPGVPQVRSHIQDCVLHVVRSYDVDAVHFDDYFYPYPVAGQVFDDGPEYRAYGGGFAGRAAWRRSNIDALIRETGERIRAVKPQVAFGVSPFGVWRNAASDPARGSATSAGVQTYDDLYADTRKWVKKGWIDYVCPQLYWHLGMAAADYGELVRWWSDVVAGTGVGLYIGEALYKVGASGQPAVWGDPAELSRHLAFCRDYPQVGGHVFFSAKLLPQDPLGAVSRLVADHYRRPAAAP
ncbi:glycoside hydrolase family 10 protein [Streptomyces polyrhachis]|uniref:Glycoside hydrolase family 10 protein n=1 Tax=Streptomyces polyrhachis TaxID=1282885 RepID=A0ABW2GAM5_9ACTN